MWGLKLISLPLLLVSSTTVTNGILSLDEFMAMSDQVAKHTLQNINPLPAKCNTNLEMSESGELDCSYLHANSSNQFKLYQIMFLSEPDPPEVKNVKDLNFDEVRAVFLGTPQCQIIRFSPEKLAETQVGPGGIDISKSDSTRVNKDWKFGITIGYKSPFDFLFGGASISVSNDYSKSASTTTQSTIGTRFEIPEGSSCTPHILRYSILCQDTPRYIRYYQEKWQLITHKYDQPSSQPRLIPVNHQTNDYFKVISGCIDFSRT